MADQAARLVARKSIAHFVWRVDDRVAFSYGDENSPDFFYLSLLDWEDFGRPTALTVTLQPGDLLN